MKIPTRAIPWRRRRRQKKLFRKCRRTLILHPLTIPPPPPPKIPFQYSLADMFVLTTAVAVFMSIMSLFPLHTIAGVSGLGALFSLILLIFWPPEQPLLRLGWWVLFALYLLACIGAIIFKR